METKTYLIKHEYDENKNEMISKPCKIEIRFNIYDAFACLEIIGFKQEHETIKHLLLCHKDQTVNILKSVNNQIENEDDIEQVEKNRFVIFNDQVQWGLHGQLDLEDAIATKKEGS